mmetsp:Transcript_123628/g.384924  ORF Transcript_123628/g.384924 Transcript_123628/m.384924 type:complete len:302 (+) Transcript_123628:181-1086(+)
MLERANICSLLHGKLLLVITLVATVRLLDVGISLEVVLVDDAAGPRAVVVPLVQRDVGVEPPLARLPRHEVVHGLVQRRRGRKQLLGPRLGDDVGDGGPHVLGLAEVGVRLRPLDLGLLPPPVVAIPPAGPAEVDDVEVGRRQLEGAGEPLREDLAAHLAQRGVGAVEDQLHVVLQSQRQLLPLGRRPPEPQVRVRAAPLASGHSLDLPGLQVLLGKAKLHLERLLRRLLHQRPGPDLRLAGVVDVAPLVIPVLRELPLVVLGGGVACPLPLRTVERRAGGVERPLVVVREVGVARGAPRV